MRLLVDTNIFLEVILEQEKAADVRTLLAKTEEHEFFISDYSLHSMGLILFRRKKHDAFRQFLSDMIFNAGVGVIALSAEDMEIVTNSAQRFNLDFDDAYQYTAVEKYNLTIVSFDNDFDRSEHGRKTPAEVF